MAYSFKPLSSSLAEFCVALRFLTIIPISWGALDDEQHFKKSLLYFPCIGVMIGSIGYLVVSLALLYLPQPVVAVVAVIYLGGISGFLHLDGLSDSADGLLSSRPRGECLKIMKDSRVGAMGVIALVCVMLAKFAALSSMSSEILCLAVFFMPVAGRCAILFSMAHLPYARSEGGLGGLFYSKKSKSAALVAMLLFLVLLAILAPSKLLVSLAALVGVPFIFGTWCRRQLGGATGDTLGAVCELTEMAISLVFVASFSTF